MTAQQPIQQPGGPQQPNRRGISLPPIAYWGLILFLIALIIIGIFNPVISSIVAGVGIIASVLGVISQRRSQSPTTQSAQPSSPLSSTPEVTSTSQPMEPNLPQTPSFRISSTLSSLRALRRRYLPSTVRADESLGFVIVSWALGLPIMLAFKPSPLIVLGILIVLIIISVAVWISLAIKTEKLSQNVQDREQEESS